MKFFSIKIFRPNDIVSVNELEQLVGKLQTINRTLSCTYSLIIDLNYW